MPAVTYFTALPKQPPARKGHGNLSRGTWAVSSTTWVLLRASHKALGNTALWFPLSAALQAQNLPEGEEMEPPSVTWVWDVVGKFSLMGASPCCWLWLLALTSTRMLSECISFPGTSWQSMAQCSRSLLCGELPCRRGSGFAGVAGVEIALLAAATLSACCSWSRCAEPHPCISHSPPAFPQLFPSSPGDGSNTLTAALCRERMGTAGSPGPRPSRTRVQNKPPSIPSTPHGWPSEQSTRRQRAVLVGDSLALPGGFGVSFSTTQLWEQPSRPIPADRG